MITTKQLERAWNSHQHERMYRDLVSWRPEGTLRFDYESGWMAPAAAMAMIRLDELCQSYQPLFSKLLHAVLTSQQADGGWGDIPTTAICLRALMLGNGAGAAIERGLAFLGDLQKPNGLWPQIPHPRLPEDALASASVLYHLGNQPAFQAAVHLDRTVSWFEQNESFLDAQTQALWNRTAPRCRILQAA